MAEASRRGRYRFAIVVFSDGEDNQSRLTRQQALEAAQRAQRRPAAEPLMQGVKQVPDQPRGEAGAGRAAVVGLGGRENAAVHVREARGGYVKAIGGPHTLAQVPADLLPQLRIARQALHLAGQRGGVARWDERGEGTAVWRG